VTKAEAVDRLRGAIREACEGLSPLDVLDVCDAIAEAVEAEEAAAHEQVVRERFAEQLLADAGLA
jgi:hypothetical protein